MIVVAAMALGAFVLRGRWSDPAHRGAVGAALALGLAGYALSGRPDLPEQPAQRFADAADGYAESRLLLLPSVGDTGAWLTYSDALSRNGDTLVAIRGLETALADHPRDAALWTGSGEALARHAGHVVPAARLAFDRAIMLAPADPAPRMVLGLALLRDGDPAAALAAWAPLVPPRDAPWAALLAGSRAAAQAMLIPPERLSPDNG